MEGLGFTSKSFGKGTHDVYFKEPVLNFEMHRVLFAPAAAHDFSEYYRNVEERFLGDGYEKHFSTEDFYLYFLAHEYKHYAGGGTGLRSLLDTYVLLTKTSPDTAYVAAEAQKLGLTEFEASNRSLAFHLFGKGELTEQDREMLAYYLSSGAYGTMTNQVRNRMKNNRWTKLEYMLHRLFLPVSKRNSEYATYAGAYPFFYKYKILLPVLFVYRAVRAVFSGRLRAELSALRTVRKKK